MNFVEQYATAIKYGLIVLAVASLFLIHIVRVHNAEKEGFRNGQIEEKATWLAREHAELTKNNLKLLELEEKYRALERKSADDVAAASAKAQKEIDRVNAEKATAIASAERYRLRWTTGCSAGQGSGGDSAAAPGSTASPAPGTAACELPEPVRQGLIELAVDANRVVAERNWLLEIAQKDREVCR